MPTTGDGTTAITVPAALGVLPRWHRAGSFVAMFARAADTILLATAAGVTSYTDHQQDARRADGLVPRREHRCEERVGCHHWQ